MEIPHLSFQEFAVDKSGRANWVRTIRRDEGQVLALIVTVALTISLDHSLTILSPRTLQKQASEQQQQQQRAAWSV